MSTLSATIGAAPAASCFNWLTARSTARVEMESPIAGADAAGDAADDAAVIWVSINLPRVELLSAARRAVNVRPAATMIVAAIDIRAGVNANRYHGRR